MGSLSRKIKDMERARAASKQRQLAEGAVKPKKANPRRVCGCGANLADMTDKHAAQHVARCIE